MSEGEVAPKPKSPKRKQRLDRSATRVAIATLEASLAQLEHSLYNLTKEFNKLKDLIK